MSLKFATLNIGEFAAREYKKEGNPVCREETCYLPRLSTPNRHIRLSVSVSAVRMTATRTNDGFDQT